VSEQTTEQTTQVEYFVILTVQTATGASTVCPQLFVGPQATRKDIYEAARTRLPEQLKGGVTVFFSAEPNRIGGAA
jgi:hypothetical protein